MDYEPTYRIFSIGDSAITIDFGSVIDETVNTKVLALFKRLQQHPFAGMIEAVPAYSSLSIFYNVVALKKSVSANKIVSEWMKEEADRFIRQYSEIDMPPSVIMNIPVCYDEEFGIDLPQASKEKNLSIEEIIRMHCGRRYRVFMLGFLPGFPYMGEVDEKIAMPRKSQPRPVAAGSVAIAGRQTGIYSLASPGGWSIVGRTPLKLFDSGKEQPTLLNAGDTVEFYPISKEEFLKMQL